MRISRRISRASALAVAALAVLTAVAGCSGESLPSSPAATAHSGLGVDDIQILSALALDKENLAGSFGGQPWQDWSPSQADQNHVALAGPKTCKADIDLGKATQTSSAYFLPASTSTAPASPTSTKHPTGTSTGAIDSSSATPKLWVGAVSAVFADNDDALKALGSFGVYNDPQCGGPSSAAGKTYVGGPGPVQNTWYGSKAMTIVVDTRQKVALSAVAQVRGRFVVVVYTIGHFDVTSSGYYVLTGTDATNAAAAAGTHLLSQLTNEVVSGG